MVNAGVIAAATAFAALAASVDGHGNLVRVTSSGGSAGPMGQNAFRDGIVRGDSGVPGPPQGFRCDWCVLENRPRNGQINGQWWTETPAAHWNNPNTWPSIPCMSNDGYGSRGTLNVRAGEAINVQKYMNADHGGFYRYEFANGTNPTNDNFMGNPITPWLSLHASAETGSTYPGRVVGYTKGDTDAYIYDMPRGPGGLIGEARLNPSNQDPDSGFCQSNYNRCFVDDQVTIPPNTPNGQGVFRWNWFSLETGQVYTNCIDVVVTESSGEPPAPGTPTLPPTTSPPPPSNPGGCGQCWDQNGANNCGMWCTRAWNEGCAAVGCSSQECDFC
jgi:hypothetical protein